MTRMNSPVPDGRWAQVTFASFGASAGRRTGGWQAGPSLDASPEQREWIKQNAVTQLSPLEPISDYISDAQVDALPRSFTYLPEAHIGGTAASVYLQAVPAGRDSTNRQGNIFTHAFVDSQPWADGGPWYPVDCFGSPDFLRPFTIRMVDNVQLARTPDGGPRPGWECVPTAEEAIEFILRDERRAASLYRIQDALQSQVATVVLPVPDRATAASWLKAVSVTMSPLEAQRLLRFTTFMRGNTVSGADHGGAPALVCVPDVDVHLVPVRPGIAVISPDDGGADPGTGWSADTAELLIRGGRGPRSRMDDIIDAFREETEPLRDRHEVPRFGAGLAALRDVPGDPVGDPGDISWSGDGAFSWGDGQPDPRIAGGTTDRGGVLSATVDLDGFGESVHGGDPAGRGPRTPAPGGPQEFGDTGWGGSGAGDPDGAEAWGAAGAGDPDPADPGVVWETRMMDELRSLGCTGDGWEQPTGERRRIPEFGRRETEYPADRTLGMLYAGVSGSLAAAGTYGSSRSTACVDATVEMLDVAVRRGLVDPDDPPGEIWAAVTAHREAVMGWFAAEGCPSLDRGTQAIVSGWWNSIVESDVHTMGRLLGNPGSLTSSDKREALGFPGTSSGLRRIEVLGHRVLHDSGSLPDRDAAELYGLVAEKLTRQLQLHPGTVPVGGRLAAQWDEWFSQWENRERIDRIITAANDSGYSALNFTASFGPEVDIGRIITRLRAGHPHFLVPPGQNDWPLSRDTDAVLALLRLRFTVADFSRITPLLSTDGTADGKFRDALDHMLIDVVDWNALEQTTHDTVASTVRDLYIGCLRNDLATATAHREFRERHRKLLEAEHERLGHPEAIARNPDSRYWAVRRQIIELHLSGGSTPAAEERQ